MPDRINGQIWIDKKEPNRLKYYVNKEEYTVLVSDTYTVSEDLPAGTVVCLNRDGVQNLARASFPDDLDRVLGVLLNDTFAREKGSIVQVGKVRIGTTSTTSFTDTDLEILNSIEDKQRILGTPVYWSVGYCTTEAVFPPEAGKLTVLNPSGHCWFLEKGFDSDAQRNLGYDNLPQIGNIAGWTEGADGKLTELVVYCSFSKFDSSLEWSWPYIHDENCGVIEKNVESLVLRTSLLTKTTLSRPVVRLNTEACLPEEDFENSIHLETYFRTSNVDKTIDIHLNSPEALKYRISGEVSYRFDVEHPEEIDHE